MFATHRRKVWRDLWSRKGRTLLVSLSIFVGVLGVVTLTGVSDFIIGQLQEDLKASEIAMFSGFVSLDDEADPLAVNDEALFATLENYPGVTVVEGWANGRIFWKLPEAEHFIESNLRAFSKPLDQLQLEPITLMAGAFPTAGQKEMVIERRMADRYSLSVGDEITVRIIADLEPGTIPEETWKISGIVFHPYTYIGASSIYVTREDAHAISGLDQYNLFQVRFDHLPDIEEAEVYQDYIEAKTPYEVRFADLNDPEQHELLEENRQWANTLIALAVVAMLVASFLVVTIINSILVEQRRQIGVMKSLGATRMDNFGIYTGLALAYGVIGSLPAVVLGVLAAYWLAQELAPLANVYIRGFSIPWFGVLVGLLMGLSVPVLASSFPIYRGTRVSILAAMTDLGLSSRYGNSWLAKIIHRLPVPPNVSQGFANLSQQKGRYFLTGLTLTLAAGAFMGVSAVFVSADEVIDSAFSTFDLAVSVYPDDEQQDIDRVSALILENIDEVKAAYGAYNLEVDVEMTPPDFAPPAGVAAPKLPDFMETHPLFINGYDPTTDVIQLNLAEGEAWQNDPQRSGIVLTETAAQELHKHLGDTLVILHEDKRYELEVIGIDKFPFPRGFMRWDELARIGEDQAEVAPRALWLQLKDENATAADADRVIGDLRELLLVNGITAYFDNQIADEEENSQTILTVGLLFNIASAVMASIGAIGLLASLSISVYERQREIGVMRSVGASTVNIVGQFLTEGLLVGIIAWIIALPVSVGINLILIDVLPLDFELNYPPMVVVVGLVGAVIIAFVASLYPSIIASRKTVSEILRYQ